MRHRARASLALGLSGAALLALRLTPPALYALLPRCPVHRYLGLLCPGCGATRAMLHLLHGEFAAAWDFNPLAVTLLPFALLYLAQAARRAFRGDVRPWPQLPNSVLSVLLLLTAIFTVVRNLPHRP